MEITPLSTEPIHFPEINTLAATLPFHAHHQPTRTALISDDSSLSYRELDALSNQSARALQALGLPPFARIAYLGQETAYYYELLFACAKSATVLVPINWRLAADEVKHILRDSQAMVILIEASMLAVLEAISGELTELQSVVTFGEAQPGPHPNVEAWRKPHSQDALPDNTSVDDPVAQLYTSGTTGLPKGVVLAHRSFFKVRDALHAAGQTWIDWQVGDISLIGIPGFHVGGLWWSTQGFNAGATNVSMRTFQSSQAVALIQRHNISTACVVPAMIQMMLNEHGVTPTHFSTLRKVVYGGSPISETLLEQAIRVMQCDFAQIYGLTETGNTAVCLPPTEHRIGSTRLKAAGRAYPGFELKIVDVDGQPLPSAEIGEICIRTPAHMREYWNRPVETAETLVDGWIFTGDAGYLDSDGYVYICDRLKDMVIVAGENVYPAEVENALCKIPEILDAAVIGIPDERWGEALLGCIVLRPGEQLRPRQILLAMKGLIADYKIPSRYEFLDQLPRNPSGKILRRVLRQRYWQGHSRQVN